MRSDRKESFSGEGPKGRGLFFGKGLFGGGEVGTAKRTEGMGGRNTSEGGVRTKFFWKKGVEKPMRGPNFNLSLPPLLLKKKTSFLFSPVPQSPGPQSHPLSLKKTPKKTPPKKKHPQKKPLPTFPLDPPKKKPPLPTPFPPHPAPLSTHPLHPKFPSHSSFSPLLTLLLEKALVSHQIILK